MPRKTNRLGILIPIAIGTGAALIVIIVSAFLACGASCGIISQILVE